MAPRTAVTEPGPDLAERMGDRWRRWVDGHPTLARRARKAWVLWAWCSLAAVLVTAILVPSTRRGMSVYLWMQYALVQFWLLARTKTITWRGLGWAFSAGVVAGPLIGVVDNLVSHAFGWRTSEAAALVWVAGPVEEGLKLSPVIALTLLARNRWRRLSICDFVLLGAASGAGFQFVEDAIRRMTAGRPSLLDTLLGTMGETQHRVLVLWPGWSDYGGARFPSHFAATALVAAGLGLALHLRRRHGRWLYALPAALLGLVMVDHSLYNASVAAGGVVPGWLEGLWSAWGSGREVRPLLLVLLVVAVVLDHRTLRAAEEDLPPIPGNRPLAGLDAWAIQAAQTLARRLPADAAPVFHRAAAAAGRAVETTAAAVTASLHDLAVAVAGARSGPRAWLGALGFVRERRGLGFAVEAGPAGRRHVEGVSAPVERQRRALVLLLAGAAVVVGAMLGLPQMRPSTSSPVFLANLFDELGRWWNGLEWWQQVAVVVGLAGLLTFGGMGFLPALSFVSGASTVAAYGQGTATFLRDPRQATKDYVRNLTPGEVAAQLAGAALNRVLPAAAGSVVGKRIRSQVLSEVEKAALNRSRNAFARAADDAARVNAARGGRKIKAAASDGGQTLSGWTQPRPAGFSGATPEEVRDLANEIGHELQHTGGLDQVRRGGFPGQSKASHAEKQLAVLRPNDPIAVSEPMCGDCRGFFQRLAVHHDRRQVVTDPAGTWIFRPQATVEFVPKEGP